jgi:hypothetical protein
MDIANFSPTYKGYWAQWNSLVVRDSMLERHWESANGWSKTAQIALPHSKVNEGGTRRLP